MVAVMLPPVILLVCSLAPNGTTVQSAGGAATTFVATDTFTPDRGTGAAVGPVVSTLDLVIDDTSGLVTGLSGLGGDDSVEIKAGSSGITATAGNDLVVETEPTIHSTSINVYDSPGWQTHSDDRVREVHYPEPLGVECLDAGQ